MGNEQTERTIVDGSAAPTDHLRYLSASALGTELRADELAILASRTDLRRYSKGEILITEGEQNDRLYAVARGQFSVMRGGRRGQERLSTLGPGMITGELAFLDNLKRTATVTADSDECYVIVLSRRDLESLLPENPETVYKVMRAIVRSAHRTVNAMDSTYMELMGYISG